MKKIKVIELFAGIGSQTKALKRLGIPHEVVAICEWDKYAYESYKAIHGEVENYGDITKVASLPYCDLLTYSFPCQDISVAGKQKGFSKGSGTRSGLLWEVERLLKGMEVKPKYLLLENVKNLVGEQNRPDFEEWLRELERMGYVNYWDILNAKDYGIPQNRERVFVVSIRKDVNDERTPLEMSFFENKTYRFPEPFDNGLRLKDFLEDEVDEKYYLDNWKVDKLLAQINVKGKEKTTVDMTVNEPKEIEIANCITARYDCGISNQKQSGTGVVVPCLTPDRVEKRQNGRRFKEDGEPMFTLTGQDRHEVLVIDDTQGFDGVRTYDNECPTLRSERSGLKVVEPNQVKQVGNIVNTGNWNDPQRGRIYDPTGCSPALNTVGGGGLEPKILVKEATKQGYVIAEEGDSINIQFPDSTTRRGRVGKGVAGTLETSCNQAVVEKKTFIEKAIESVVKNNDGEIPEIWDLYNKNPIKNGIAKTLSCDCGHTGTSGATAITQNLRIRKLTPKECWLLMGFGDEDFEKAEKVNSNSQLYKQAGNSIVVDVLVAIFRELFKED